MIFNMVCGTGEVPVEELHIFQSGTGGVNGYAVEPNYPYGTAITAEKIYTSFGSNYTGIWRVEPQVDLTGYSTLKFDMDAGGSYDDSAAVPYYFDFGVAAQWSNQLNGTVFAAKHRVSGAVNRSTVSIDVSGISGMHYITLSSYFRTSNVYNIWLE